MSETITPIAGWYPSPSGDGRIQWWDGSQWTERFGERTPQPEAAGRPAAKVGQQHGSAIPYSGEPRRLVAPAGTPPYTPFICIMAAIPLAAPSPRSFCLSSGARRSRAFVRSSRRTMPPN